MPRKATKNQGAAATNPAAIVPLLPFQKAAIEEPSRFNWACWCRQTGKSFSYTLRRIIRGMKRNRNQIFLSAGMRQTRETMAKARTHLQAIKIACDASTEDVPDSVLEGTKFGQLETRVRHRDGIFDFRIIALPANPETARGYTGDVFLDEFALHRHAGEIWRAVMWSAMRTQGEVDVCSTPRGKKNKFYQLVANKRFTHTTVTLPQAVEAGLDIDIEEFREALADDDGWLQEAMCQFLDENTAFLTYEMIGAIEALDLTKEWDDAKIALCANEELYGGTDIGRHRDLTVIWIWGRVPGTNLLVTRGVIEMSKARFRQQEGLIDSIMRLPNMRRMAIDATGLGEQIAENLVEKWGSARMEAVKFSLASKGDMARELRVKCEDRTILIPMDHAISTDWHSIEKVILPGGQIAFRAERNVNGVEGHADRFWAAALGIRAASVAAVPFEWHSTGRRVAAGEDWKGL